MLAHQIRIGFIWVRESPPKLTEYSFTDDPSSEMLESATGDSTSTSALEWRCRATDADDMSISQLMVLRRTWTWVQEVAEAA
jgi:hypothetical protein